MNDFDSEILDTCRMLLTAFEEGNVRQDDKMELLSKLLKRKQGDRKLYLRLYSGNNTLKFFRKRPVLNTRLSQFILLYEYDTRCKTCNKKVYYHAQTGYTSQRPDYPVITCDNLQVEL